MVQEECEKWPFQSFIYNPKAREWPAEEAIGAWTPAANETLGARFFSSCMNAYIPRATTQQVTCAGGFLSSVRSQNSTSQWRERHILQSQSPAEPVHRREELRCIAVLCTGDHWARWHCVYQCAGVLLKRHMLHSQVSAVSTESLWQNKHDLLRCGNCQVISWCINWPQGWNLVQQVVHVRMEIGISQIARKLYSKFKKKILLYNTVVVVLCAPKLEDDFMNPRAVLTFPYWIQREFYLILTLVH